MGNETIASYAQRLGFTPAIFNIFVPLPLTTDARAYLQSVIPQLTAIKAQAMLTIQPTEGLAAVSEGSIRELADYIKQAERVRCSPCVDVWTCGHACCG